MSDKPILFSAPMIKAILREIEEPGTGKTQTRRTLNPLPRRTIFFDRQTAGVEQFQSPRFVIGDRLWVREAWRTLAALDDVAPRDLARGITRSYEADGECLDGYGADVVPFRLDAPGKLRPSMFMPRWASRITLTVTDVRVQRLQEISEEDAIAEGIQQFDRFYAAEGDDDWDEARVSAVAAFARLWDNINGNRPGCAWQDNPWIVAYSFNPVLGNIDQLREAA